MRIKLYFCFVLMSVIMGADVTNTFAQSTESLYQAYSADSLISRSLDMDRVVVVGNAQRREQAESTLSIDVVDQKIMTEHFSGDLMKSLEHIPGVQSMSIGSGFSKPMIRGMGFNRVSVVDSGVKQEGQQWGADHGLEIDAFNVERVNIRKGSSSLLYGSDAMGGVVEIKEPVVPREDGLFGSVDLLGRSVNGLLGGSLMMGYKRGGWFIRGRHSEQYFGDFGVPTDTVVYLTQKMPITDNHVNNTAGQERATNLYARYGAGRFSTAMTLSDTYQKMGFYPGAHGIPDPSRVYDDGTKRDVDLPYSTVNHFKASSLNKYWWDRVWVSWDVSYQNNHREEWSSFHTHYNTQEAPAVDPDKEIELKLQNYASSAKVNFKHTFDLESTFSWDVAYQNNDIAGYSFLLPSYRRLTTGAAWVTNYKVNDRWSVSGGVRYDWANISTDEYVDEYLAEYLTTAGWSEAVVAANYIRSYELDRNLGDFSFSAGAVFDIDRCNSLRVNLGRSYRLPTINELVSNGVHHSSFRHEQGDPTLKPEYGWQLDLGYGYSGERISLNVSPYVSWYATYIYQQPTGEWSVLPHAGQIYRYTQNEALFAGGELSLTAKLPYNFVYDLGAEYTYTYNIDEHIPLAFSPPMSMRNSITWSYRWVQLSAEWRFIADQNRVARNEEPTPGAQLFGASALFNIDFVTKGATALFSVDNIFNTYYLNHLSFYRQVEIPEAGRNFQLSIKIPFQI